MQNLMRDLEIGILKIEEERKIIEINSMICTSDYCNGIIEGLLIAENILQTLHEAK